MLKDVWKTGTMNFYLTCLWAIAHVGGDGPDGVVVGRVALAQDRKYLCALRMHTDNEPELPLQSVSFVAEQSLFSKHGALAGMRNRPP